MDSAKKQIETQGAEKHKKQLKLTSNQYKWMRRRNSISSWMEKLIFKHPYLKKFRSLQTKIYQKAAPGIDKELQPKLNKTMGTMQKSIQREKKKEEEEKRLLSKMPKRRIETTRSRSKETAEEAFEKPKQRSRRLTKTIKNLQS